MAGQDERQDKSLKSRSHVATGCMQETRHDVCQRRTSSPFADEKEGIQHEQALSMASERVKVRVLKVKLVLACRMERMESLDQGRRRLGWSSTSCTHAFTAPLSASRHATGLSRELSRRRKHLDSRSTTRQTVAASSDSRSFAKAIMEGKLSRLSRVASKLPRLGQED
mmetsp:Transcript_3616/g.12809  ORF Transcript_3616/g.12809 Transcript_3616/m.12809 type:complete len:168 (-) Transcript_3616:503-1006(-)